MQLVLQPRRTDVVGLGSRIVRPATTAPWTRPASGFRWPAFSKDSTPTGKDDRTEEPRKRTED